MDVGQWVALAAFVIAAASLISNTIGLRQKAAQSYTDGLEWRIEDLERRMKDCEQTRDRLAEKNLELAAENTRLMRDLLAAKKTR